MIVAQLRGARFLARVPATPESWNIAQDALDDVVRWLGFKSSDLRKARDEYLRELLIEREKIFLRAKDKK